MRKDERSAAGRKGPAPTSAVAVEARLKGIVEETVRRHLARLRVSEVDVEKAVDHDGDPVLRVTVVFTKAPTAVDGPRLASISRHIGEALEAVGLYEYVMIRFVSERDAPKLKRATA